MTIPESGISRPRAHVNTIEAEKGLSILVEIDDFAINQRRLGKTCLDYAPDKRQTKIILLIAVALAPAATWFVRFHRRNDKAPCPDTRWSAWSRLSARCIDTSRNSISSLSGRSWPGIP
jgi:hypothetical protein